MRIRSGVLIGLMLLLLVGCSGAPQRAEGGAGGGEQPRIALKQVVDGLSKPLYLIHAGDGSGRLYLLEQAGRVRVMEEGRLLAEPFLDLTDRVLSTGMEQGLLSLAFAPDFARSGLFYVHYTGKPDGQTVVARYRLAANNPRRGDPGSEEVLLTVDQPFANHNGGSLLFGPDGYLYLALGDGGSAGDPGNRAQNLEVLLGKILRVDVSQPGAYQVPSSNPFVNRPGLDEIWAYGLRNPWRISFDRATGDLYIADVGQAEREEVNFQPAGSRGGENYGWKVYEGTRRYSPGDLPGAVFPVAEYTHEEGGCAITGGYVYRGKEVPGLTGIYLYGDYCTGKIWGLQRQGERWVTTLLLDTEARITSFGEDEAGENYVVDQQGAVYRLVGAE